MWEECRGSHPSCLSHLWLRLIPRESRVVERSLEPMKTLGLRTDKSILQGYQAISGSTQGQACASSSVPLSRALPQSCRAGWFSLGHVVGFLLRFCGSAGHSWEQGRVLNSKQAADGDLWAADGARPGVLEGWRSDTTEGSRRVSTDFIRQPFPGLSPGAALELLGW